MVADEGGAAPRVGAAMLMEALGLGLFMVSAGVFGTALEYPGSPLHQAIPSGVVRRALMGVIMGLTAVGLVRSPWGQRSGAHLNPAVTWTFFRLGRVRLRTAVAYTVGQFVGGVLGVALVSACLGRAFLGAPVEAVATLPGAAGMAVAFLAEVSISGALMLVVLALGRSTRWQRHTPWAVGILLFLCITLEAPLSGMSMNPARSLASAVFSRGEGLWLYFVAPLVGMLLAAEVHLRAHPRGKKRAMRDGCAKLLHAFPCLFCGGGGGG